MTSVNNNSEPFGLDIDEKVMFFIEGANLHALAKNLDMHMDFAKLHAYFQKHCRFVRANYYTTMNEDAEYNSIRPLIDWLSYNGYNVLTKPAKEHVDSLGRRKIKGNVDVEIAVDMLEAAKTCDHIVLFSSDADFLSAVTAVQRMGVRVTVVSTIPSVGDELRRRADHFVDLDKVRHLVGKPLTSH
ncbi:MAG: NYN domain-containing protein, partial [Oxalobacteraceae bacterium]